MSTRSPIDVRDGVNRPLKAAEVVRKIFLDELEKHVRGSVNGLAVLVRDYGMQDMHDNTACKASYLWWRVSQSLNPLVDTDWFGGLEFSFKSRWWTYREACWYFPFDWKLRDEPMFGDHDTLAVCIKNFRIESSRQ